MEKTFWIFSLVMLVFSTFAPSFTYATGEIVDEPGEPDSWISSQEVNGQVDPGDPEDQTEPADQTEQDNQYNQVLNPEIPVIQNIESSEPDRTIYTDPECISWFKWDGQAIKGYCWNSENIVIPEGTTFIYAWIFDWRTIRSFQIPENVSPTYSLFSWAILDWEMSFSNQFSNSAFEWAIIWPNGRVTIWDYSISRLKVEEWGILNINAWNELYMSSNMVVDWTINVNKDGSIYNAFQNIKIWETWKIIMWDGITTITNNCFYNWTISWDIIFPNNLSIIWNNTFARAHILTWMNFPNSLTLMEWSVFENARIEWNMNFWESTSTIKWDSNAIITWDIVFNWTNVFLQNFYQVTINWSLVCNNCGDVEFQSTKINSISWDFRFISNWDFKIWAWWLDISRIWWDFIMSWNKVPIQSVLYGLKVWGDMTIKWDKISLKYGALNGASITWNLIMSWNYIELDTDVVNDITVNWDLVFNAWLLKGTNWVLNSLKIWWYIRLPENTEFQEWVLWGVLSKWISAMGINTKVSIWETISNQSVDDENIKLVVNEIESVEVEKNNNKTKVKNTEIQATSGKVVEYQWWLEVYFQNSVSGWNPERIEWTANFSSPIAIKVPVLDPTSEYVKIKVKHADDEDFWYTWLTLNSTNECVNWIASIDQYTWEDVIVEEESNWDRFATIYTCSASTFVAYSENDPVINNNESQNTTASKWSSYSGWRPIVQNKQETKATEEHNSAATEEKTIEGINNNPKINESVEQKVKKIEWKSLTRWEVAVMTNILLDVYPQLAEKKTLNEVLEACENYVDEQDFTKDEKKAITRLCKLSIMWIHSDNKEPLDEFLAKQKASNWEFATVMDRVVSNYNEKDLSTIKEALNKLEWDEEWVVFGTVYNVFMSIKNIFQK